MLKELVRGGRILPRSSKPGTSSCTTRWRPGSWCNMWVPMSSTATLSSAASGSALAALLSQWQPEGVQPPGCGAHRSHERRLRPPVRQRRCDAQRRCDGQPIGEKSFCSGLAASCLAATLCPDLPTSIAWLAMLLAAVMDVKVPKCGGGGGTMHCHIACM